MVHLLLTSYYTYSLVRVVYMCGIKKAIQSFVTFPAWRKVKVDKCPNAKVLWLLQILPHRLIWKSQNMDILPADLPLKFSAENSTVVHWYNGELIFHADNVSRFLNRTNHQKIHGYLSRFNEWCCGWFWNYFHPPSMSDLLWCEVKFSASSL